MFAPILDRAGGEQNMENIPRVMTALDYPVVVSFTRSVSAQCPYFLAIDRPFRILASYRRLVVVGQCLAFACRVSVFLDRSRRIATRLPSHHEIDSRNPEVFLNFRVLRGEFWYPASSNRPRSFVEARYESCFSASADTEADGRVCPPRRRATSSAVQTIAGKSI
jgi:hypothetical protein